MQKKLKATLLFIDFSKAFDSMHREKIEQIQWAYCLPKETALKWCTTKPKKAVICSLDSDSDFFKRCCCGVVRRYIRHQKWL